MSSAKVTRDSGGSCDPLVGSSHSLPSGTVKGAEPRRDTEEFWDTNRGGGRQFSPRCESLWCVCVCVLCHMNQP